MQTTMEYIEAVAPEDVLATLRWLTAHGYEVSRAVGAGEHMGSALVVFSHSREVTVLRDRGQWDISVALSPGGTPLSLAVLNAARLGVAWDPGPHRPLDEPLAPQLPEGMIWHETLPLVLEWLDQPGATAAVEAAAAQARESTTRWWKEMRQDRA
ncbi:MAG TPA: hypothetical protein VLC50_03265 [Actinomycetes bacterium]|nr:hypothetical protein [Actinomycetes bacterium]